MLKYLIRITFIICLIYLFVSSEDIFYNSNFQPQKIISIRAVAFNGSTKTKNFDANFYYILEKGFLDQGKRIEYEKRQR